MCSFYDAFMISFIGTSTRSTLRHSPSPSRTWIFPSILFVFCFPLILSSFSFFLQFIFFVLFLFVVCFLFLELLSGGVSFCVFLLPCNHGKVAREQAHVRQSANQSFIHGAVFRITLVFVSLFVGFVPRTGVCEEQLSPATGEDSFKPFSQFSSVCLVVKQKWLVSRHLCDSYSPVPAQLWRVFYL